MVPVRLRRARIRRMLRDATPDDLPFLWEMLATCVTAEPKWTADQARSTPTVAVYLEGWGRPGDVGFVAIEGDEPAGEPIGAAWYRTFTLEQPAYGFVDETIPELAVSCVAGARGRGVGRSLVEALLAHAHEAGIERLSLSVDPTNRGARWLYDDLGFVPLGPNVAEESSTMVARTRPAPTHPHPTVRAVAPGQLGADLMARSAWGDVIASAGLVHRTEELFAFVAEDDGEPLGLVTWRRDGNDVELVGLESWADGRGVGTALLAAVRRAAADLACTRVWLITNNDSTAAIRFYQRRGWDLLAIHRFGADRSRGLKPSIPWFGDDDIPARHEVELELLLGPGSR